MQWILSNLGSIICALVVLAIVIVALRSWFRSKKNGCGSCGGCGGNCGSCSSCSMYSSISRPVKQSEKLPKGKEK